MDHIVIMKKSWGLSEKILSGEKNIESRWYKQKRSPWDTVSKGDNLYIKNSGESVTICAQAGLVLQFGDLDAEKVKKILYKYQKDLGIVNLPTYLKMFCDKKYCILVYLEQVRKIKPFSINKKGFGNMSAWISTDDVNKIKCS